MPIVRRSSFTMYMFQYHTLINEHEAEAGCFIGPTDPNGLFPSHKDWQELANQVGLFYDSLTPAELDSVNQHTLSQQESRQQQRVTSGPSPRQVLGYVYLLKGGDYYKIGLSKNVNCRLEQITPRLPFETELICTIATDDVYSLETNLHELYADKRANGEWFELDDRDVEYIRGLADGQD